MCEEFGRVIIYFPFQNETFALPVIPLIFYQKLVIKILFD